jgi:hypothetical protein
MRRGLSPKLAAASDGKKRGCFREKVSPKNRPLSTWAGVALACAEIGCDLRELVEGGLEVLDNLGCQDGGVGAADEIVQVARARVLVFRVKCWLVRRSAA